MNQSIKQCLDFYCEKQVEELKSSDYFAEISSLAKSLDYLPDVVVGEVMDAKKDKYPKIVYLSFSIVDQQKNAILVDFIDCEHLSDATRIIEIDRKRRVKFFSWQDDEDFIDSLKWIVKELKKIKKTNVVRELKKSQRINIDIS